VTDRVRLVVPIDGRLAVIKRWRPGAGTYAVLPGGGLEPGETMEDAASREAIEELGIDVRVIRVLADDTINGEVHTFVLCEPTGDGEFGTGEGDEYSGTRDPSRGTYEPALVPIGDVDAIGLLPTWVPAAIPDWLS
jgi:8-oxo-dGTP diphosphatase